MILVIAFFACIDETVAASSFDAIHSLIITVVSRHNRAIDCAALCPIIEGFSMYLSEQDIKQMLNIIGSNYRNVTLLMEIMSPAVVKKIKEKSIDASNAKFTWGIRSGKELESYGKGFRFVRDISLTEGMKELYPIYKILSGIGFVRNLSNKITVMKSI